MLLSFEWIDGTKVQADLEAQTLKIGTAVVDTDACPATVLDLAASLIRLPSRSIVVSRGADVTSGFRYLSRAIDQRESPPLVSDALRLDLGTAAHCRDDSEMAVVVLTWSSIGEGVSDVRCVDCRAHVVSRQGQTRLLFAETLPEGHYLGLIDLEWTGHQRVHISRVTTPLTVPPGASIDGEAKPLAVLVCASEIPSWLHGISDDGDEYGNAYVVVRSVTDADGRTELREAVPLPGRGRRVISGRRGEVDVRVAALSARTGASDIAGAPEREVGASRRLQAIALRDPTETVEFTLGEDGRDVTVAAVDAKTGAYQAESLLAPLIRASTRLKAWHAEAKTLTFAPNAAAVVFSISRAAPETWSRQAVAGVIRSTSTATTQGKATVTAEVGAISEIVERILEHQQSGSQQAFAGQAEGELADSTSTYLLSWDRKSIRVEGNGTLESLHMNLDMKSDVVPRAALVNPPDVKNVIIVSKDREGESTSRAIRQFVPEPIQEVRRIEAADIVERSPALLARMVEAKASGGAIKEAGAAKDDDEWWKRSHVINLCQIDDWVVATAKWPADRRLRVSMDVSRPTPGWFAFRDASGYVVHGSPDRADFEMLFATRGTFQLRAAETVEDAEPLTIHIQSAALAKYLDEKPRKHRCAHVYRANAQTVGAMLMQPSAIPQTKLDFVPFDRTHPLKLRNTPSALLSESKRGLRIKVEDDLYPRVWLVRDDGTEGTGCTGVTIYRETDVRRTLCYPHWDDHGNAVVRFVVA